MRAPSTLPPATERQLRVLLKHPGLRDARIGLAILDIGTAPNAQTFPARPHAGNAHPLLFGVDANKRFMPASNAKLFTAVLALHALGANTSFPTRLMASEPPHDGIVDGPIVLVGGGDPSFGLGEMRDLAQALARNGIKQVGGVRVDDGAFRAETFEGRYPNGWTLDDTLWYYGAEVSALAFERNQVDVFITGAAKPGMPALVRIVPPLPGLRVGHEVENDVLTGGAELKSKGWDDLITIDRAGLSTLQGEASLRLSGKVAPGQTVTEGVAMPDHARIAAASLHAALEAAGVRVAAAEPGSGGAEEQGSGGAGEQESETAASSIPISGIRHPASSYPTYELARHDSPTVGMLLHRFLKNSDNLYGEMLLRDAAFYPLRRPGSGTADAAHHLLLAWLRKEGLPVDSLRLEDGSGLSRYNLVTPRAIVQLLAVAEKVPGATSLWRALPIAGVDGTLKKRMKNTPAQYNVRAKTGTFSIASNLSGYVSTCDGHRLAVSVMTNFVPDGDLARRFQDRVYAILAAARW